MTERQFVEDQPTGKIITTCDQRVQRSISALCWYNLMQNYYFTVQRVHRTEIMYMPTLAFAISVYAHIYPWLYSPFYGTWLIFQFLDSIHSR
jgi:hypothetical protein